MQKNLFSPPAARTCLRSGKRVRVFAEDLSLPVSAHHLLYPRGFSQFPRVKSFLARIHQERYG